MHFRSFIIILILLMGCEEKTYDNPIDPHTELNPDGWAPINLIAEILVDSTVILTWQQSENQIDGFNIERKDSANGTFAKLGVSTSTSYTDTTVILGNEYSYRVAAYNSANTSGYSNIAIADIWMDCNGIFHGEAQEDCSGICNGDKQIDACDICGGPGSIYQCGCWEPGDSSEIAQLYCDCDMNTYNECGTCGNQSFIKSWDDGSFESGFNAGSANYSAVSVSVGDVEVSLQSFQWYQNESGGAFYLKVFEDDSGMPGNEVYSSVIASDNSSGWNERDLSGINVSGDFWIGTKEFSSTKPFGLDTSFPSSKSYTSSNSGATWSLINGDIGYRVELICGDN